MNKNRYYDSSGAEISERHALDRHGILKDGCTMRVTMTMRDSAAKPLITDGHGNDGPALRRPGYRISTNDDRRQVVADAYSKYQAELCNRYKCSDGETLCDDCDGEGYDEDGNQCETCGGSGVVPSDQQDSSPKNDTVTRDQMYSDYDESISNQWRGNR